MNFQIPLITFDGVNIHVDASTVLAYQTGAQSGYCFDTLSASEGTDWEGVPATITSVSSLLFDGDAVERARYGNVSPTFKVRVTGSDSGQLATGMAALETLVRADGMHALQWTPGDLVGPPTVIDVLIADAIPVLDDVELGVNQMVYAITCTSKPFPRSATLARVTGTPAPLTPPTTQNVGSGATVSNWSTSAEIHGRTNWVINPSFSGNNTIGWAVGHNGSTIRTAPVNSVALSYSGLGQSWTDQLGAIAGATGPYLLCVNVAEVAIGPAYVNMNAIAVSPGKPYAVSFNMLGYSRTGIAYGGFLWRWFDSSGNKIGADQTTANTPVGGSTNRVMTPISAVITAPSNAYWLAVYPWAQFSATGSPTITGCTPFVIDSVMIEQASSVGTYFDGNTAGAEWSGAPNASYSFFGTPAVVVSNGTAVSISGHPPPPVTLTYTLPTSITVGSNLVLAISGTLISQAPGAVTVNGTAADGSVITNAAATLLAMASGANYYSLPTQITTITSISVLGLADPVTASDAGKVFSVSKISIQATLPPSGTGRETNVLLPVVGSAAAEIEITASNGSQSITGAGNGFVVVYTSPSATTLPAPALRPYRSAGTNAPAAAAGSLSGSTETLGNTISGATSFTIPNMLLRPGTHGLGAWFSATTLTAGTTYRLVVTVTTNAGTSSATSTRTISLVATSAMSGGVYVDLGQWLMPVMSSSSTSSALATTTVSIYAPTGTFVLDELFCFNLDVGQVTILSTTGQQNPAITSIDYTSPSASESGQSPSFTGTQVSGGDTTTLDLSTYLISAGNHTADPADGSYIDVFVAATATSPAITITARYYPRWVLFAAPLVTP